MSPRLLLFALLLLLGATTARAQDLVAYDNALENGWANYSWATTNLAATSPVHGTSGNSIAVDAGPYTALYLHHAAINSAYYTSLTFWINGGASGGQGLQMQATLSGQAQTSVPLAAPTANTWTQVTVTLVALGVAGHADFDGFWIQSTSGNTLPTYYVDDVTLVATPAPALAALTVNAGTGVRTVDGRIFGVNLAVWDAQMGSTASRSILTGLRVGALRCPGGSSSDDFDWQVNREVTNNSFTWTSSFPNAAQHAAAIGAQLYTTVNYGSGTPQEGAAWVAYANGDPANTLALGTDAKNRDWKTVGYWAALRAATPLATDDGYNFLRIGRAAPFALKYWEIGNECYGGWEHDEHGSTFPGVAQDPYTYAQAFAQYRAGMLAVDPTIHIGAVVTNSEDSYGNTNHTVTNPRTGATHTGWTAVLLANLKSENALPTFLIYHDYPQNPGSESDAGLLQGSATLASSDATALRQMLTDYIGTSAAAGIELALTELNSVSDMPGKQSTSLVDALFMADAIGALAGTEFNACTWWDLRNGSLSNDNNSSTLYGWRLFGDYGLVAPGDRSDTPLNTPYPTFYAMKLLTQWAAAGDRVISATTSYPYLSMYASIRAEGTLSLLVVNKNPNAAQNAQLIFNGFAPTGTATRYVYGPANDTGSTDATVSNLTGIAGGMQVSFPAYSITLYHIPGAPASFAAWQNLHFTTAEMANPAISADNADPDGDGISNLLEYAFALDPRVAGTSGLPAESFTTVNASKYLTITYTKVKAETDLTYTVQVSSDLANWQSGSAYTLDSNTADNGPTQTVTTRDLTPITPGAKRFIRLRVTR